MLNDADFMARALALAERGRGRTSPNPMVGALVVDFEGVIVGRGAHEVAGGPHAEVYALEDAGERARGATLYCTLEPCSHTGRTGPCAPLVAEAGIARAVIAVQDPNPRVAGRGLSYLRGRGVEVSVGVLRREAEALNRPFFSVMRHQRPFVTLKAAISRDGGIAAAPGTRTAITGAAANRLVHRERAEVDAIAIGSGTVLADDPLLTPRGAFRARPLTRVVFDSRLRTPPSAKLLSTRAAGPVIIVSTPASAAQAPDRVRALADAGVRVEIIDGQPPLNAALRRLAHLGIQSLVVEGGARLHRAFWDADLVDRLEVFQGPRDLGPGAVP
ncbi:MAG TPA: bifunctional diaminohydroxyphosphoribosylaminopyrimidine deaminase/5-amino-6-(5-phosphoribosylamino)uracil reductase RibD, partial [Vicinamibacterales bacterium]